LIGARWIGFESCAIFGLALVLLAASPVRGQDADEREAVLGVTEAALAAISTEDMSAVADLMLDESVTFAVTARDSLGEYQTMSAADWRTMVPSADFVERGFRAEVHVAGPLASVWLPYDFYVDGKLSHCGVDAFTLVRTEAGWRIASLAFTRRQPPDCSLHPEGPPVD